MTFLPEPGVLLTYSLACFVLFVTPGPDMSLFLAKTIAGGRKAGLASMLGAMTGCCVHTLLAALGLSALLAASATAFTVLKVVGALYLLWLAVDAVRNGSALSLKERGAGRGVVLENLPARGRDQPHEPQDRAVLRDLPAAIRAGGRSARGRRSSCSSASISWPSRRRMAAAHDRGRRQGGRALRDRPKVMRAIDYTFAGLFSAFAVRILATSAR